MLDATLKLQIDDLYKRLDENRRHRPRTDGYEAAQKETSAICANLDAIAETDEIAKLYILSRDATPGPWEMEDPAAPQLMRIRGQMDGDVDGHGHSTFEWPHIADIIDLAEYEANGALIVACVNWIRENLFRPTG